MKVCASARRAGLLLPYRPPHLLRRIRDDGKLIGEVIALEKVPPAGRLKNDNSCQGLAL
jgi:hypothetical protein